MIHSPNKYVLPLFTMSLDINWQEALDSLLRPEYCCSALTDLLNASLPSNSALPLSNFRVTEFDLQGCQAPEIEIIEVGEVKDEYLVSCGVLRSIHSSPPSQPERLVTIDSASVLFDRNLSGNLMQAAVGDGIQVTASLSFGSQSLRAAFEAEAFLNIPAPGFLCLPFRMVLTGAALNLQVSLVCLPDGRILLSLPRLPNEFDFQLAVEVGDSEKHVLRNVGKIEKFLMEQVRVWMAENLLFPRYQVIK